MLWSSEFGNSFYRRNCSIPEQLGPTVQLELSRGMVVEQNPDLPFREFTFPAGSWQLKLYLMNMSRYNTRYTHLLKCDQILSLEGIF